MHYYAEISGVIVIVPSSNQRRSQDFFLGGATRYIFRHLSGSRPPTADRVQWGGGGSSRNFSRYQINHIPSILGLFFTFSGRLRVTRRLWTLTEIHGHFPRLLTHSNHVTASLHSAKNKLTKVWGGPWPPWPPLATPLVPIISSTGCNIRFLFAARISIA